MKRQAMWVFVALVGLFVGASSANAQPPVGGIGTPQRPAYSPYLNLVRPGGTLTQNYYGLVRPEVQARNAIQNLQGATVANQQAIGGLQTGVTDLPTTGHQASFLTHGSYFLTGGAGGGGSSFGGGRQNFARPPAPQR